jgi:acyl carrier protein
MMEPILAPFAQRVRKIALRPPKLPFISNVTGTWITAAEATDPAYWGQHLRQPVRFADGVHALLQEESDRVLLEVGAGHTLSTLARQCGAAGRPVVTSLRRQQDQQPDLQGVLAALGKLWLAGVRVDWSAFYAAERRRRLPLPTYPFERQRYWVEPRRLRQPVSQPWDEERETAQAVAGPPGDSFSLYPRPNLINSYVAPSTPIERRIAAIWQELLGIQQVGLHDNFFDLGGHSLTATQMAARLQAAFPVDLTLGNLFEATTIAQIAEIVEELLIEKIEALPEDAARVLAESLFESDA